MFRILIVEDMEEDSRLLKNYVARNLPEALVDVRHNVQEGREAVEQAVEQEKLYDAVVLDFKLPESAGENAELNESLCEDIGLLMPEAIIAHLTAFMEDDVVQAHMKRVHDQNIDTSLRFDKNDPNLDWPDQLVGKLKMFLYGARVERKLNKLTPPGGSPASTRARRDRAGGFGGSSTHELVSLQHEIAAHWTDYDDKVKAKIERTFEITRHGDRTIVTLR